MRFASLYFEDESNEEDCLFRKPWEMRGTQMMTPKSTAQQLRAYMTVLTEVVFIEL